ncbi:hypothetical protein BRADI_4g14861v3 [Brachypodium distachyon]|uniref:F-box domain-containing protein n=1 Tax=Brachypodium distachyon TaxID=15368 RepID=A0A0Q3EP09_BRADI|nr:hypothetical protein BRADI_4g14861v3 [Brachypodium distachyon]
MESDSMVNTVPRSKRSRTARATASPSLPEDIILCEILPRLPAKDLLHCRAVCRSWRRETSTNAPSNEYRTLFQDFYMSCAPYKCNVLTISFPQHQQRCIGHLPAELPSSSSSPFPDHWSIIPGCDHPPFFLHGCLHWHFGKDMFVGDILVFNTVLETFRLIQAPPKIGRHREYLLDMDGGKLGMGFIYGDGTNTVIADIWALEGYRKEEAWVLQRRIELPVGELRKHALESGFGSLFPQIVSGDGDPAPPPRSFVAATHLRPSHGAASPARTRAAASRQTPPPQPTPSLPLLTTHSAAAGQVVDWKDGSTA